MCHDIGVVVLDVRDDVDSDRRLRERSCDDRNRKRRCSRRLGEVRCWGPNLAGDGEMTGPAVPTLVRW
jgi:hypothetical protein